MSKIKRAFKRNSHSIIFKQLAAFGRALNRFYENRNHDINSNGEVTVLKKIAKISPEIIIDGGANIGNYSLEINKYNPSCKIYSFEPVETTYKLLKNTIKSIDNIIPINKGLFSENCSKEINLYNYDTHSSLYDIKGVSYESQQKTEIDLITGDFFLENEKISDVDFLKIDVEGAEFEVLKGFENSIKSGRIKAIQFEYGYINITTKKLLADFYEFFDANNYVIGKIFPKTVEFRKYDFLYEDFIGPNFIAVKKSETELIKILERS